MSDAEDDQKSYVGGRGRVLLLDKIRYRETVGFIALGACFLLFGAFFAIMAVTHGFGAGFFAAGAAGVTGALTIGTGVLLSVLRVAVTSHELRVQYGMGVPGPRIPIANIVECNVEKYDHRRYGDHSVGFPIIDGRWLRKYTVPTAEGRVVRVRWRDGKEEKEMMFSSEQPDAVLAAIRKAMAMRAGGGAFRMHADVAEALDEPEIENEEREAKRRKGE